MPMKTFFLALGVCLVGLSGPVRALDQHVVCVQEQLAVLGYDPGPADGVDGADTRRALARFMQGVSEKGAHAAFDALPEFSEHAAVGWCREIGNFEPRVAQLMPAAEPPLILTMEDVSPRIRGYIQRSYEDARQTFAEEYGVGTASKPVLIVAFDRDDLEQLLLRPVPGIPDLSAGAARRTAEDLCVGVERIMGAAYRHRIALCMPPEAQSKLVSYEIWNARYQYVMLHEYMHHVQREMSFDKSASDGDGRRRMGPAWMIEGSAYLAQIKSREGPTRLVSVPMLFALRAEDRVDPIPLEQIRLQDSVKGDAEYAASNLSVALLALRFGEERMVTFWRATGELGDWDAAFEMAYGFEMTTFETLFEEIRHDNDKLAQFARGEAPYDMRRLISGPGRTVRIGHANRQGGARD